MSNRQVIPPRPPREDARTEHYRSMPAEQKIAVIRAMGFSPQGANHDEDCPATISGYRCNCVRPATVWAQPADVDAFRHETYEERMAERGGND